MRVWCNCGKTLNPEGRCDASHALSEEQYAAMLKRRQQIETTNRKDKLTDQLKGNQNGCIPN